MYVTTFFPAVVFTPSGLPTSSVVLLYVQRNESQCFFLFSFKLDAFRRITENCRSLSILY